MHDPLWSLLRQWQVGEFAGEDAGTPLAVTIETASTPLTLFAPGAIGSQAALAGVTTDIPRAGTGSADARFRVFEPSVAGTSETARGLLTIGGARGATEGPPRETVLFLRDETVNMVWGVETTIEDASGLTRSRRDEPLPIADFPPPDPRAELRYTLETEVPRHWIPMVPVPTAGAENGFVLRKGTMTNADDSRGRILAGKPRDLFDPEVPRSGIRVSRTPTLARDAAGRPVRWTALRSSKGFGELTSGFASDSAAKL